MPFKFGLRRENRVGLENGKPKTGNFKKFTQTPSAVGRFHEEKMRGSNNDPDLNFNAVANVRPLNVNSPNFFEQIRPNRKDVLPKFTNKRPIVTRKAKAKNSGIPVRRNNWNWNASWENVTPKNKTKKNNWNWNASWENVTPRHNKNKAD